jgi:hypothetical protein
MATNRNKSTTDTAPAPAEQVDKKQAAAEAFAANPKAKKFFQTSDGQCFAQEGDAKNHAKRLGDKEVDEVTPEAAEEEATADKA